MQTVQKTLKVVKEQFDYYWDELREEVRFIGELMSPTPPKKVRYSLIPQSAVVQKKRRLAKKRP